MPALSGWLWRAQLRAQPGRFAAAALSIAIGVALALAIHLVNRSALEEFDAALAVVNGEAQARIEARSGSFDEALWPRIAKAPEIAAASPALEAVYRVADSAAMAGGGPTADPTRVRVVADPTRVRVVADTTRLRVVGIDPLLAARVTPDLLPRAAAGDGGAGIDLFADDAIFLSRRSLELLGARVGDPLTLLAGDGPVTLRIAGTVDRVPADVTLAVMDIGTMQWRLGWTGRLSRIDLRLAPGVTPASLTRPEGLELPAGVAVVPAETARQRMSNLSRAYRVNLTVLALVALFTGGFIVHAAMALVIAREQSRLALLGVLGADRRFLLRQVLGLGLLPGLAGSVAGLAAGVAGARLLLGVVGGDLGGGYFAGSAPPLAIDAGSLAGFALAGIGTALAGSLAPAIRIMRQAPARALRAGGVEAVVAVRAPATLPIALAVLGALLLAAPPVAGLPLAAYATIALWLVAGIGLLPRLLRGAGRALRSDATALAGPAGWLAAQRVAATPAGSGAALGGIVAAVALASAMAIMVTSFRTSVDRWLGTVLPADVYGRLESAGPLDGLDEATQRRIAAIPGIAQVEFLHASRVVIDPGRPAVALLARDIDPGQPQRRLPITGALLKAPPGTIPIWVSEAIVDLYGWTPGSRIGLPAEGVPADASFFVAGVWRDYARQHGAIVVDLQAWRRLTGEARATDVSLWLAPGESDAAVVARVLETVGESRPFELRSASSLRALSLKIFDRSFAATWALEAVAIVVALFGVASAWSAEAIARRREFGVLRHLGMTPAAIVRQFALEAGTMASAAVGWGLALGAAIALVLVHRVNPQSFHWTMDVDWPIGALCAGAAAMVALAVVVAALAARQASSAAPVRAVREDW